MNQDDIVASSRSSVDDVVMVMCGDVCCGVVCCDDEMLCVLGWKSIVKSASLSIHQSLEE
jgi:hypothetical protein